jgi:hypothetical protein
MTELRLRSTYYKAGGQTVAVRRGSTLNYLLADHLGSTSKTIDSISKRVLTEVRYKAWGEERYNSGAPPTSLRFTGQRAEAGLGLYFYKARCYDPRWDASRSRIRSCPFWAIL